MKYTKADVFKAFERYREVTGDTTASLHAWSPGDSHGTRYEVQNSQTLLDRRRVMLGAYAAWSAIHAFCDGYQSALKAQKKEEVIA